jgi:serine protease DegQ
MWGFKMKKLVLGVMVLVSVTVVSMTSYGAFSETADRGGLPSLAPMLENVTPAVVIISTTQSPRNQETLRFRDQNELRRFFSDPSLPPESTPRGALRATGSGVIVDAKQGYIVTNHHVIANADAIKVSLQDGREFEAQLIGSDAGTDVALLQIEADGLMALGFADIDDIRVGDYVVAVGNPFGIGQTVTQGIVSALGRGGLNNENYEDFIQTDAAINVGNSGGALVDLRGRLVGINTAIISGSGSNAGIAFAVPVDMIAAVMQHLERDGEVRRGQLGVQIQDLTSAMESALATGAGKGALVTSVLPGSAAETAGLEVSDVIIEIDGRQIESGRELRNIVGLMRVGEKVELVIYRDGQRRQFMALIGGAEPSVAANDAVQVRELTEPMFQGAQLRSVDSVAGIAQSSGGVEVVSVDQQSPAWRAGLRPGDVIYEVNRNQIESLQDFNQIIRESSAVTALSVVRENRRLLVILS